MFGRSEWIWPRFSINCGEEISQMLDLRARMICRTNLNRQFCIVNDDHRRSQHCNRADWA